MVTQSDRLVAADRLGLPTYNPRMVPAIRYDVDIMYDGVMITYPQRSDAPADWRCVFDYPFGCNNRPNYNDGYDPTHPLHKE